jgi:hypothetical protein
MDFFLSHQPSVSWQFALPENGERLHTAATKRPGTIDPDRHKQPENLAPEWI